MRSRVDKPRHLPLALSMLVDEEGGVWLRRTHSDEQPAMWTRLRADGTVLGDLNAPRRMRIFRVAADHVWAAQPDDDGVETLHRCRIR